MDADASLREAPVALHNRGGRGGVLLLCEHASAHIPEAFDGLGLSAADRLRHIAWDIGALALARGLADALDAPLVHATYSRLLLDLNRPPDAADSIVERSEGTDIPGNLGLDASHRHARRRRIYDPFHAAVSDVLDARHAAGLATVVVSIHSFTPRYHGQARPWHAGVIARGERRLGDALLAGLRADARSCIGDNEPYAPVAGVFHSIEQHAEARGLDGAMIEVRQDLLGDAVGVAAWTRRLATVLSDALPR
jgi:predicted N-formylglutamate amidohydrolase